MNILKTVTLAFLVSLSSIAQSIANPEIKIHIKNGTFGTLKMNKISGVEHANNNPLVLYNVGPGTSVDLHFNYERKFTYDESQLHRNKVEPVRLILEYEVHGYKCMLQTSLIARIVPGLLRSSYEPTWPTRVITSGNNKYKCNAKITKSMVKPPFSYTVELAIEK